MLLGIILIIFSSGMLSAEIKKTGNQDLRQNREVFSIEDLTQAQHKVYKMMTSPAGAFSMIFSEGENPANIRKINNELANQIDEKFADQFISIKYEMASNSSGDKCKKSYVLSLRGESHFICVKETKQRNKMKLFINNYIKELGE